MRRCARGRRFPSESRYSLSAPKLSSTRPNSWGRQAAASGPGIEDAPPQARRFYEPQKHGQQFSLNRSPEPSPMLGSTRRENRKRFSRLKNRHCPKLAPILRPVSASLRLRFRSATFFARLARGSSFEPDGTALRGRRPGDPGGTERYCVSLNRLSPILCARAWGNLVKTRQRILTRFPSQGVACDGLRGLFFL